MKNKLIIMSLFFLSFTASANSTYSCTGHVDGVGLDPKSGDVLVKSIGDLLWPRLCSVKAEMNGVSVEACKTIYSTLLTAQTSNKTITLWFSGNKTCTATDHPAWQTLDTWYFGPVINN